MYKFFTILAGIYVLLLGLLLSVSGLTVILGNSPQKADYPAFVLIGIVLMVVAVGVFMRKNLARLSMMIVSCLTLILGSISCVGVISTAGFRVIYVTVFYAVFVFGIPALMMVLFNARPVKEMYAKKI